jgi:hypothetical protein
VRQQQTLGEFMQLPPLPNNPTFLHQLLQSGWNLPHGPMHWYTAAPDIDQH